MMGVQTSSSDFVRTTRDRHLTCRHGCLHWSQTRHRSSKSIRYPSAGVTSMTNQDPSEYLRANRALWNEWTTIHERSADYNLAGFKVGGSRIRPYELEEIGDV